MQGNARIKTVTVSGVDYQLRKLTPVDGGYIWQRLMAGLFHAQQQAPQADAPVPDQPTAPDAPKPSAEERLRGLCTISFMHFTRDDYAFAQTACMKAASVIAAETGLPMPVMSDGGVWTRDGEALRDDPFAVTRLTVESLVFSLYPYLAESATA